MHLNRQLSVCCLNSHFNNVADLHLSLHGSEASLEIGGGVGCVCVCVCDSKVFIMSHSFPDLNQVYTGYKIQTQQIYSPKIWCVFVLKNVSKRFIQLHVKCVSFAHVHFHL